MMPASINYDSVYLSSTRALPIRACKLVRVGTRTLCVLAAEFGHRKHSIQVIPSVLVQTKRLKAWTSTLRYSGNQCPEQKQSWLVCSENRTEAASVLGKKLDLLRCMAMHMPCCCSHPEEAGGGEKENKVGNHCRELKCWSNFISAKWWRGSARSIERVGHTLAISQSWWLQSGPPSHDQFTDHGHTLSCSDLGQ